MAKTDRVVDIRDAAMKFLEHKMRTEKEMRTKLVSLGYAEEDIDGVVELLRSYHYIDDHHYALEYIDFSSAKGRGRLRIKQELLQKGIDRETVEDAFVERAESYGDAFDYKDSERERALEQARKICERIDVGENGLDEKQKAKIARRLAALGYAGDAVFYALGRIKEEL